jgi:hypothetical protein
VHPHARPARGARDPRRLDAARDVHARDFTAARAPRRHQVAALEAYVAPHFFNSGFLSRENLFVPFSWGLYSRHKSLFLEPFSFYKKKKKNK